MKGLLIKDLKLIKRRGIFLLLVVAVYSIFQLGSGNSEMGVGFATLMVGAFSFTAITYDEYENGMPFLLTLPVKRKDYVREKYVFAFLIITATWLIMNVVHFVLGSFALTNATHFSSEEMIFNVTYLLVIYFMTALGIALKLKFSERGSIVMIVAIAVVSALGAGLYFGIPSNIKAVIAAAAVLYVVFIYAFYRWSIRIMEKREF